MTPRTITGILAGIVLLIGIILLVTPVSAATPGDQTVACGTALKTDTSKAAQDNRVDEMSSVLAGASPYGLTSRFDGYAAACDSALTTRRIFGWSLAGLGALAGYGAYLMPSRRRGDAPTAPPATPAEPA